MQREQEEVSRHSRLECLLLRSRSRSRSRGRSRSRSRSHSRSPLFLRLQARRRIADEEEANKQGGFGLLQADTSGFFDVEQQAEALAFFQENGCASRCLTSLPLPR